MIAAVGIENGTTCSHHNPLVVIFCRMHIQRQSRSAFYRHLLLVLFCPMHISSQSQSALYTIWIWYLWQNVSFNKYQVASLHSEVANYVVMPRQGFCCFVYSNNTSAKNDIAIGFSRLILSTETDRWFNWVSFLYHRTIRVRISTRQCRVIVAQIVQEK